MRLRYGVKEKRVSEVKRVAAVEVAYDAPDPQEMAWAFPEVPPGMQPFGGRVDRKSTHLNSSHVSESRMPSSA